MKRAAYLGRAKERRTAKGYVMRKDDERNTGDDSAGGSLFSRLWRVVAGRDERAPLSILPPFTGSAEEERPSDLAPERATPVTQGSKTITLDELKPLFSNLGNNLWRLRRKMLDPKTGDPRHEMRFAYNYLDLAWQALEEAEVEIKGYDNDEYDPGLPLKVIAFQEISGIEQEIVLDTIKPSILYCGKVIQLGNVIVGIPAGVAQGDEEDKSACMREDRAG